MASQWLRQCVGAGTSVGDRSKEARAHAMGVELNVAEAEFLGDKYAFIDCPGSVEFGFETEPVLPIVDVAVVVCEADDPELGFVGRPVEMNVQISRDLYNAGLIPVIAPVATGSAATGRIAPGVMASGRAAMVPVCTERAIQPGT